jgi:hypothetical protein
VYGVSQNPKTWGLLPLEQRYHQRASEAEENEVLDDDRTFTARAGSVFYIPKGTLHAWRNATTEPARALLVITPAGFEGVIEEVGVPGTLSSPPPPPPPHLTAEDLQRIEELGRKYDTEYPPVPAW